MDFAWVYGTLVRNTGWTLEQCWQQPADFVFEFLSHLGEHPPCYVLMAEQAGFRGRKKKKRAVVHEESSERELSSVFGPAQPMPESVRALMEWADNPDSWKKK